MTNMIRGYNSTGHRNAFIVRMEEYERRDAARSPVKKVLDTLSYIFISWFGVAILVCSGLYFGWKAGTTPEAQAARARRNAAEQAELQPHVIREFDGCKVYRFKEHVGGRWHFVTRCGDKATHESSYSVRHGKGHRIETETITTER